MRYLIFGSRTFGVVQDYQDDQDIILAQNQKILLKRTMDSIVKEVSFGIVGGAKGADTLGELWLVANRVPFQVFMAEWDKYGRTAGPRRNRRMIDEGKPDIAVGFIDYRHRAEVSPGSSNMMQQCRNNNIPVEIFG